VIDIPAVKKSATPTAEPATAGGRGDHGEREPRLPFSRQPFAVSAGLWQKNVPSKR
jgi:hypothetical protein